MNAAYERYLRDEEFRASILAAARRARARAIAEFLSKAFRFNSLDGKPAHAPRAHFARQG
jgi:hypothetical protein